MEVTLGLVPALNLLADVVGAQRTIKMHIGTQLPVLVYSQHQGHENVYYLMDEKILFKRTGFLFTM